MMIYESGDLPAAGAGADAPNHEELVSPSFFIALVQFCFPYLKKLM